mgnify:CR=1 FL=1
MDTTHKNEPVLTWVMVQHWYQPPHQTEAVVRKVTTESYELIVRLLTEYPNLRITINLAGSLVELWEKYSITHIISALKPLVLSGQVELLGSAIYHPILPLVPSEEIDIQVQRNSDVLTRAFESAYAPAGFFAPELAYSPETMARIAKLGFTYAILDEYHALEPVDPTIAHRIAGSGVRGVFRNRLVSKTFPPEYVVSNFHTISKPHLITAHDGELWGHWHNDDNGFYQKAFSDPRIVFQTVSQYLAKLTDSRETMIRTGTWETENSDYTSNNPFPLWNDPANEIHQRMWKFAHHCEELIANNSIDSNAPLAREQLSLGLVSCGWWWASAKRPAAFSPLTWNPDEIEKVLLALIKSARTLLTVEAEQRVALEKEYAALVALVWEKHWQYAALEAGNK